MLEHAAAVHFAILVSDEKSVTDVDAFCGSHKGLPPLHLTLAQCSAVKHIKSATDFDNWVGQQARDLKTQDHVPVTISKPAREHHAEAAPPVNQRSRALHDSQ
jgi:hypothetical protein